MARVTVEDCIKKIPNRFELVMMASKRAKDLDRGAIASISKDDDKSTIVALREIAEESISLSGLKELTKRSTYEDTDLYDKNEDEAVKTVEELMQEPDNPGMPDPEEDDIELDEEDLRALEDMDTALTENDSEQEEDEENEYEEDEE